MKSGMARKIISCALVMMLLSGCMSAPALANAGSAEAKLSYTVKEGFDFDDTTEFASSEEAWAYADQIVGNVNAAAEEMRAIFAQRTVSITDEPYGAQAHADMQNLDSTKETEIELAKKNTAAIYQAICDVSAAGGGTVVIPAVTDEAGNALVFYTAAIHLEDNVNLHLEKGAQLKFTTETSLYQGDFMKEIYGDDVDDRGLTLTRFEAVELMGYSPFIYAYGKKNIALTGENDGSNPEASILDGQARNSDGEDLSKHWHQWKASNTYTLADGSEVKVQPQGTPRTKLFGQGQANIPVAERQYGESTQEEWSGADDGFLRPNMIQPYNCQNVLIEGITLHNSPMWEINPVLCDTVLVQNNYIESHMSNNDGCNPESTSNMVIHNNYIDTGDDCVAIKSGRNGDGLRIDRSTFNLVVENNTFVDGHGGVTIGSEITGGVKNAFSRNNVMDSDQLQCAYRFKTNYIRGGVIENIYYKDDTVKMVQSSKPVILVDLNYDVKSEINAMEAMMPDVVTEYQAYIPQFKNVLFEGLTVNEENVEGNGGKYALQLNGFDVSGIAASATVPEGTQDCYISNFVIRDAKFVGSVQAFQMTNVDGLVMENVTITGTTEPDALANCLNLQFTDCDFTDSAITRAEFDSVPNANLTGTAFDD